MSRSRIFVPSNVPAELLEAWDRANVSYRVEQAMLASHNRDCPHCDGRKCKECGTGTMIGYMGTQHPIKLFPEAWFPGVIQHGSMKIRVE